MPLQIDATTRYATGNYTEPLTEAQLNSPSPYNTRIHKGLPPTPIDNPGLAAIAGRGPSGAHQLPVLRGQGLRQRREVFDVELQPVPGRRGRSTSRRAARAAASRPSAARRGADGAWTAPDLASASSAGRWRTAARRRCRTPRSRPSGCAGWRYQLLPIPPELFDETVAALAGGGLSRRQRHDPAQASRARARHGPDGRERARSAPPTR